MKSDEIRLIELPKIEDERGNLSFIQFPDTLPFVLKRTYWIYDVARAAIHVRGTLLECRKRS